MQKYTDAVQNRLGMAVEGAKVLVTDINGSVATIFSNNGTTQQANPMTTDANGRFAFYAADGRYNFTITINNVQYGEQRDILLNDPADPSPEKIDGGVIVNSQVNESEVNDCTITGGTAQQVTVTVSTISQSELEDVTIDGLPPMTVGGQEHHELVEDVQQLTVQSREALRRSYADAGYNLVDGSFEEGGVLTSTDDVMIAASCYGYSWEGTYPVGGYSVAPGTDPTVAGSGYVPRTDVLRDQLAADGGAGMVGVKLPFAGAAARTQRSKNMDYVSLLDFAGADPTGTTPSTAAFQAALDACSDKEGNVGYGRALHIPAGVWVIDGPLVYNWRNTNTQTDADARRLTICGAGSSCTFINDVRAAPGTAPLITFDGGQADPFLRLSLRDLRFQRPAYDRLGWGIYFKNVAILDIRNVDSQWFLNGVVGHDVLYGTFDHCQFGANDMGIRLAKLNWTRPNVILFSQSMFGGNASGCVEIVDGANIKFDTCNFEGTGTSNTGSQAAIRYTGGPEEGGIGLTVVNSYFENNHVFADITIESNSEVAFGTHLIEGNTFQRVSPTRYCRGHINFSPNNVGGFQRLHFRANTFKFIGGYTHHAGDFSIAAQTDWAEVIEEGNIYNPAQLPIYTGMVIDGYDNKIVATAKVSMELPSITAGHNVASVSRVSTGVYRINFKKALSSVVVVPTATVEGGLGHCSITGYDNTFVEVTTYSSALELSNAINFNVVCVGIKL